MSVSRRKDTTGKSDTYLQRYRMLCIIVYILHGRYNLNGLNLTCFFPPSVDAVPRYRTGYRYLPKNIKVGR